MTISRINAGMREARETLPAQMPQISPYPLGLLRGYCQRVRLDMDQAHNLLYSLPPVKFPGFGGELDDDIDERFIPADIIGC